MVILIILSLLLIIIWFDSKKSKAEIEYLDLYFEIVALIELQETHANYLKIHRKFVELSELRYKNKEKTSVLYEGFMRKFKSVAK